MSDTYTVTRSQHIAAAPEAVFAKIVDLREWEAWSPWAAMDPTMQQTYSGEPGTVGSKQSWSGNRKVGQGSMTVTGIDAPTTMELDLEFLKPFKARNDVTFTVEPSAEGSTVTWAMSGTRTFMTKVMGLFGQTMDKMVGPDFEKGLASLKSVVES